MKYLAILTALTIGLTAGAAGAGDKPYVIGVQGSEDSQQNRTVIRMAGQDDPETVGTMCTGENWVVFSAMSTKNGKIVSVCVAEGDDTTPSHMTYRYGKPGAPELIFPDTAEGSFEKFTFRRYTRPRTTYLKFEFTSEGFNYEILDGGDDTETSTELRVTRVSDGEVIAEHPLLPTSTPLSLMQLEDLVNVAPFDE